MKKKKSVQEKEKTFDPESVFAQMSELLTQVQNISDSSAKDAENQKQDINKEIYRLSKLNKDYYKALVAKNRKKR